MKTAIIYTSRHGCTEKCAQRLKSQLNKNSELVNLKTSSKILLDEYDRIIIGGSIHAGHLQKKVKKFCSQHADQLMQKKLGLFLCCMEDGDKANEQFADAFPAELRQHAAATGLFGGEFNFDRMNFLEKAIIKKVAHVSESVSKISEEKIKQFVREVN